MAEHEINGKTLIIPQHENKNKGFSDAQDADKEVFVEKVEQGLTPTDAAIVAGYRGPAPAEYAAHLRQDPVIRQRLEDIFERKARMILKRVKPKTVDKAQLHELAKAADIMAKNARAERSDGQSIEHKHLHLHVDFTKLSTEDIRKYLAEKSRTRGVR